MDKTITHNLIKYLSDVLATSFSLSILVLSYLKTLPILILFNLDYFTDVGQRSHSLDSYFP